MKKRVGSGTEGVPAPEKNIRKRKSKETRKGEAKQSKAGNYIKRFQGSALNINNYDNSCCN